MPNSYNLMLVRALAEIDQLKQLADETARRPMGPLTRRDLEKVRAMLRRARVDAEKMMGNNDSGGDT